MTIDNQGRGSELDESRIEKENKRPVENVISQTQGTINQTLSGTENMSDMSDATSYSQQKQLLDELKIFLRAFQDRLQGVSASYENKVINLRAEGMMKETHQRFVNNQLEPTCNLISKLIEHIEHNDIPAVEKAIRDIEHLL